MWGLCCASRTASIHSSVSVTHRNAVVSPSARARSTMASAGATPCSAARSGMDRPTARQVGVGDRAHEEHVPVRGGQGGPGLRVAVGVLHGVAHGVADRRVPEESLAVGDPGATTRSHAGTPS